jgi:5-methylcytosine-specific restriction endonuclease McrA
MTRRCLRCRRLIPTGSYCAACNALYHNAAYNSTRKRTRARAVIAASPRCELCGATRDLTADHVVPVIDGGAGGPLRVLCRGCNSVRGAAV